MARLIGIAIVISCYDSCVNKCRITSQKHSCLQTILNHRGNLRAVFLDTRGYLARGVPLLKHIAALPGQVVCRTDRTITVNGTGGVPVDWIGRPA